MSSAAILGYTVTGRPLRELGSVALTVTCRAGTLGRRVAKQVAACSA